MKIIFLLLFSLNFCWTGDQIFVACEGNFYQGNGSLWTIFEDEASGYPDNPVGDVVQSLYVYADKLFVIVNGSSNIQIFDITTNGLVPYQTVDTNGSGPREMIVYNNYLYFTNWYSADVKKLNLTTFQLDASISTPGLPEDIVLQNGIFYVSITMNMDWSDCNLVLAIDPDTESIIDSYEVGFGPGELLVHEGDIYISRTYYDPDWNAYYGTSKIKPNGEVMIVDYGAGAACGGGIYSYQNDVYRIYDGGIAKLDNEMQIIPETRIGDYNWWEVYSAEVIGDNVYFGLSDYIESDDVAVVNSDGNEIARYQVGSLPGDFAIWKGCAPDGDVNSDSILNILDIIQIVDNIIIDADFDCNVDINEDLQINILDVVILVDSILN